MSAATKKRPKKKAKSVKRLNAADKMAIIKKEAAEREALMDLANNYAKRKKEWETCKAETKTAKMDMDAAFLALYEAAKSKDPMLPFQPQPGQQSTIEQHPAAPAPGDSSEADHAAFKATPIDEFPVMTERDKEMLKQANIHNGLQLQDWFTQRCSPPIRGFADKAKERASDGMLAWYEKRKGNGANGHATSKEPYPGYADDREAFIELISTRLRAAGWQETGVKITDNETALKLVRYLGQDDAIDKSSKFSKEQFAAMTTRLEGMADPEVGNIVGVKPE